MQRMLFGDVHKLAARAGSGDFNQPCVQIKQATQTVASIQRGDDTVADQAIEATTTVRLGQRLRQARLARNLTQSEVAASQFSVSYISAVERGQIRPSLGA